MLLSSVLDTFTLKTGTKYGKINKSFNISAMWSVSQSGSWVCEWAADFLGRRKKECLSPGEQGAQLASFLLFVLIELHSTQLIPQQQPSSPTPPLCSHHQHLIRQLTPPSAGGGGFTACQMLGGESLLFWRMNVFFLLLPFCLLTWPRARLWPFGEWDFFSFSAALRESVFCKFFFLLPTNQLFFTSLKSSIQRALKGLREYLCPL